MQNYTICGIFAERSTVDWIGILYLLTSSKPAREKPLETKEPRRCYLKLWSWTSTNFDRLNWTAYTPSKYFMFVSTALETANLRTTEYQPSNSTSIVVLECMKLIMCWYPKSQHELQAVNSIQLNHVKFLEQIIFGDVDALIGIVQLHLSFYSPSLMTFKHKISTFKERK